MTLTNIPGINGLDLKLTREQPGFSTKIIIVLDLPIIRTQLSLMVPMLLFKPFKNKGIKTISIY